MIKNKINFLITILSATLFFTACQDEQEMPLMPVPTIENIELGLGNNEIAVIGKDFHFEADVVAGDQIDIVKIDIRQMADETYATSWSFEQIWNEYKGLKNTNIHKHFEIPEDAVEGKYEFVITVNDQNGETLEEVRNLTIFSEENMPVNPQLLVFNVFKNGESFYSEGEFSNSAKKFSAGDTISSQASLSGVRGDGKMYMLLIPQDANHHPEIITDIDFSKVIVYDVVEHSGLEENGELSNFVFDIKTFTTVRAIPDLVIGADKDNNLPEGNAVTWKSGTYNLVMIYNNPTYGFNLFDVVTFDIEL